MIFTGETSKYTNFVYQILNIVSVSAVYLFKIHDKKMYLRTIRCGLVVYITVNTNGWIITFLSSQSKYEHSSRAHGI